MRAALPRSTLSTTLFGVLLPGVVLTGCVARPSGDTSGLPRLDVVPGQMLVIPGDGDWPERVSGSVTVRFDDGTDAKGVVRTVVVTVERDPTIDRVERWLPAPGVWTSTQRESLPEEEQGRISGTFRVLAVTVPRGSAARVLRAEGKDFALNHLPRSSELITGEAPKPEEGDPWAPTFGSAGAVSPILTEIAWPEATSPLSRWRFRMMSGTLRPELDPRPIDILAHQSGVRRPVTAGIEAFTDPIIEALATQGDSRWRVALARLWAMDPDLASRVKRRLAAVVDFGGGFVAPAWSTDQAAIDRLLSDILDPSLTDTQRAFRAESWLDVQPAGVAWVLDDAGTLDAEGRNSATACVANLGDVSTLAWVSSRAGESFDLKPLPAYAMRRLQVQPREPDEPARDWREAPLAGGPSSGPSKVSVHAGRWQELVDVFDQSVPATPPSLRLGPLTSDFTMDSWLRGGAPGRARPEWISAAMLHKVEGGWELFVECSTPRPGMTPELDVFRVWLGPLGQPRSVLRIDGKGVIADEARRVDLVPTPADPRVIVTGEKWSFRVPIPPQCIEPDGTLRIGLTRTDPTGSRAAWPRPMLPWQEEPGRLAIGTSAWSK